MKKQSQTQSKQITNWIKFSQVGLQMAITIAIFVFLGAWLDEKYPKFSPFLLVFLSLLGVFIAIYSVMKQVIRISKEEK